MILKFLRKKKNMKRIMWALAILIIPAFVIWGAGSSKDKNQKGPEYAGKIFNKKISFDQYADMWRVTRDSLIRSYGNNIPAEIIDQMAWTRIILLEMAKRVKIGVSDIELFKAIASYPLFQRNGLFDKNLYKSMLGDNAKGFEEKLRDDIRISKLREKITSNVSITEEEIKNAYIKKYEKIKTSYISIPFSSFEKEAQYEEADLLKYYGENKDNFKKPEERSIRYIEIPFSGFEKETSIDDTAIQRYFEEHISDYKNQGSDEMPVLNDEIEHAVSEKLTKDRAILLAEESAYKTLDAVIEKNGLEAPAASFGLAVKETPLFSLQEQIPDIGWSYELAQKAFELKENEISSNLIKTENAFYIIQLKQKNSPRLPEFKEIKDAVTTAFIKDSSIKLSEVKAKEIYTSIDKNIYTGMTFEDIARQLGLETAKTDFISRDGYIPVIGPVQKALDECTGLKPGMISKPVKMLDVWAIFKLDEYQRIDEAKFIEEKNSFKQSLLETKKESAFDRWFNRVTQEANFISYTRD